MGKIKQLIDNMLIIIFNYYLLIKYNNIGQGYAAALKNSSDKYE